MGSDTTRAFTCSFDGGDSGLWLREQPNTTTGAPDFVVIDDLEVNNPGWCGIQLDAGGHFWGTHLWLSDINQIHKYTANTVGVNHGIVINSGFTGIFTLTDSNPVGSH